jgi:hypothetical protein
MYLLAADAQLRQLLSEGKHHASLLPMPSSDAWQPRTVAATLSGEQPCLI